MCHVFNEKNSPKCVRAEKSVVSYLTDIADSIQGSTSNNKDIPFTRIASTYIERCKLLMARSICTKFGE